ncbi:hypothetical protein BRD05_08970 [Halobacteriales archaeon QS_9_70_65]|nr:MAG: hypothetical protein BRD05_08970 [Halobacteriales archaeon QS_9_70_65]
MSDFDEPAVGRPGEGGSYRFLDTASHVVVSAAETAGRQSVVEMQMRAGHATPMHVHEDVDETFHVREGRVTAHTDDDRRTVEAGGTIVLPRGEPHALVADVESTVTVTASPGGFDEFVADVESTVTVTASPGGFDEFVAAVGEPVEDPAVPTEPPSEAVVERVHELAGDYGIEILGPPPVEG